ncbi:hypothetical protein [Kaarinaea lacus]
MKYIGRVDQSKVSQTVSDINSGSMTKRFATTCLVVSLGVFAFAAQPVSAEEGRIGGYALEDQSMLGRYGDVNDEYIATSSVEISKAKMSADTKKKMHKKDGRLGAYSMQDNAMLGRYGDKNDE